MDGFDAIAEFIRPVGVGFVTVRRREFLDPYLIATTIRDKHCDVSGFLVILSSHFLFFFCRSIGLVKWASFLLAMA